MSEQVWVTLITAASAIIGTYLTVKYKNRVVKQSEKPKDRAETIFDGYERLILQQNQEIQRKGENIRQLDAIIARLESELQETRRLLEVARADLEQSRQQNNFLTRQLEAMKLEYQSSATQ